MSSVDILTLLIRLRIWRPVEFFTNITWTFSTCNSASNWRRLLEWTRNVGNTYLIPRATLSSPVISTGQIVPVYQKPWKGPYHWTFDLCADIKATNHNGFPRSPFLASGLSLSNKPKLQPKWGHWLHIGEININIAQRTGGVTPPADTNKIWRTRIIKCVMSPVNSTRISLIFTPHCLIPLL